MVTAAKKNATSLTSYNPTPPTADVSEKKTVNSLLHRNQSNPLPSTFHNSSTIGEKKTFANFFSDKIAKLHLSLKSCPTF
jgi:hypothetical protein